MYEPPRNRPISESRQNAVRRAARVAACAAAATVLVASPAHAYLDPGTGSMLLQVMLGGTAGAAVVLRLYWAKLRDWAKRGGPIGLRDRRQAGPANPGRVEPE